MIVSHASCEQFAVCRLPLCFMAYSSARARGNSIYSGPLLYPFSHLGPYPKPLPATRLSKALPDGVRRKDKDVSCILQGRPSPALAIRLVRVPAVRGNHIHAC